MPPQNQTTTPNNKLWLLGFFLSSLGLFFTLGYGLDLFLSYTILKIKIDFYTLTAIKAFFCFFISLLLCSILYAKNISNNSPHIRLIPIIILFILIKYIFTYIYINLEPYTTYNQGALFSFLIEAFILPFITATVFSKDLFKLSTSIQMLFFLLSCIVLDHAIYYVITALKDDRPILIINALYLKQPIIYVIPVVITIVMIITLSQIIYAKIQPWALKLHQGTMAKVMYIFQTITALLAVLMLLFITL